MPSGSNAATWRRRERALGLGTVSWALLVSMLMTFWPEQVAAWLMATKPYVVAGVILFSIGLFGALWESLILIGHWTRTDDSETLTEVPWDE